MLVVCEHCGATVATEALAGTVTCRYCGARARRGALRTVAAKTPDDFVPPWQWKAPEHTAAAGQRFVLGPPTDARLLGPLVAACVAVAAVAGVTTLALARFGPQGPRGLGGVSTLEVDGAPRHGVFALAAQARGAQGYAGALEPSVEARHLGRGCVGWLPRSPSLALRLAGPVGVRLNALSPRDVVLVVRRPDGSYVCDDDSGEGTAARLSLVFGPGLFHVWVGAREHDAGQPYSLAVEAEPLGASPVDALPVAPHAQPSLGAFVVDARTRLDERRAGVTSTWTEATRLDASCRGHLSVAPQVVLELTAPRVLRFETHGTHDVTLALRTADGSVVCDDDSGQGSNARLERALGVGQHALWVGVYSPRDGLPYELTVQTVDPAPEGPVEGQAAPASRAPAPVRASASVAAPTNASAPASPSAARPPVRLLSADAPTNAIVQTRTEVDARAWGPRCAGFVAATPVARLEVNEALEGAVHVERVVGTRGPVALLARLEQAPRARAPLARPARAECSPLGEGPQRLARRWAPGTYELFAATPAPEEAARLVLRVRPGPDAPPGPAR